MNLKEELAKLEKEEEEIEVEERLNGIQESIYGLYRRIGVIVEYIDNQKEVTTITEEQLTADEQHFKKRAREKALELKNLELNSKIKDLTKLLKEQENQKEATKLKEETQEAEKELETIKSELIEQDRRAQDQIEQFRTIIDKEKIKTFEWIVSVIERDNSKSCLCNTLNTATAILHDLNKLQNILKKL